MQITLLARMKKISQKIEQDLYWYDPYKEEMINFKGGGLKFNYVYDPEFKEHRMIPEVEDMYHTAMARDYKQIKDWFIKNASRFGLIKIDEREGYSLTINVAITSLYEVERNLYESNIVYDTDEREGRQEYKEAMKNATTYEKEQLIRSGAKQWLSSPWK